MVSTWMGGPLLKPAGPARTRAEWGPSVEALQRQRGHREIGGGVGMKASRAGACRTPRKERLEGAKRTGVGQERAGGLGEVTLLTVQMGKLRPKQEQKLTSGHSACQRPSWDLFLVWGSTSSLSMS